MTVTKDFSLINEKIPLKKTKYKTNRISLNDSNYRSQSKCPFDVLYFDVLILEHTIKRNQKQHGKANYIRRLKMFIQCLYRLKVLPFPINDDNIDSYSWRDFLYKLYNQRKSNYFIFHEFSSESTNTNLLYYLKYLHDLLNNKFTEIISHIMQCSSALFVQLCRGYFVPLCTIMLACLSRVYVLLMQLGLESLWEFRKTLRELNYWRQSMRKRKTNLVRDVWLDMVQRELKRVWNRYEGDPVHFFFGQDKILQRFLGSLGDNGRSNLGNFKEGNTDNVDSLNVKEIANKNMVMDLGKVIQQIIPCKNQNYPK